MAAGAEAVLIVAPLLSEPAVIIVILGGTKCFYTFRSICLPLLLLRCFSFHLFLLISCSGAQSDSNGVTETFLHFSNLFLRIQARDLLIMQPAVLFLIFILISRSHSDCIHTWKLPDTNTKLSVCWVLLEIRRRKRVWRYLQWAPPAAPLRVKRCVQKAGTPERHRRH